MLNYIAGFTEGNAPFSFSLLDLVTIGLVFGVPTTLVAVFLFLHPATGPKKLLLLVCLGFGTIILLCAAALFTNNS